MSRYDEPLTMLGSLHEDLRRGQEVACTERMMHRLCEDLAAERPRRYLRAIARRGEVYACAVVGLEQDNTRREP